jgi:uncharacterized membrane protein
MTSEAASAGQVQKRENRYSNLLTGAGDIKTRILFLFVCCLVLAIGLRLFHLDAQNFWYDEAETIGYATDLFPIRDIHPPTYYAIVHLSMQMGNSEFWVRFPSFVMGVASIATMYAIGRLVFTNQVTLIATLLASMSPMLVWHSQDARMYSQLLLGCLLTVYFYIQILRRGKALDWIGYVFAALFAAYTQLYAILLIFVLNCHLLLFHRQLLFRWIAAQFLLLLGYVPWLIIFLNLPPENIGSARQISLFTIPYTYFVFTSGYSFGPTILELRDFSLKVLVPYLPLLFPVGLVVSILSVSGIWRQWHTNHEVASLFILWAFVPVIIAVVIPILVPSMTYNVRYGVFSVPAFLFILASGVVAISRYRAGIILFAALVIVSVVSLYNDYFEPRYAKEDVRSAAQFVASNVQSDDHILVVTVGRLFDRYFDRQNPVISNLSSRRADELVGDAVKDTNTIWLVESRPWQSDPGESIKNLLDNRYSLINKVDFPGVSVFQYCVADCAPA